MINILALGIVLPCTVLSALGGLFFKMGSKSFSLSINPFKSLTKMIKNKKLLLGISFHVISAVLYISALRKAEISILYPICSLSYVWACLFSKKYLKERIDFIKWLALALIVIGVAATSLG